MSTENNLAPIAVFAFKRSDSLQRLLESLEANSLAKESHVHIFLDGPSTSAEIPLVHEVLLVAQKEWNFSSTTIVTSSSNLGLRLSILKGLNDLFQLNDSVIVLEDDLVVAPGLLDYLNRGLEFYEENLSVSGITGYSYLESPNIDHPFALRGAECWGWATWRNRWNTTSFDGDYLIERISTSDTLSRFDYYGSYHYSKMLKRAHLGLIESWAIYWHASMFVQNRYMIYPTKALVANLGADEYATNPTIHFDNIESLGEFELAPFPEIVEEYEEIVLLVSEVLLQKNPKTTFVESLNTFLKLRLKIVGKIIKGF
jgi:hypothetical protein